MGVSEGPVSFVPLTLSRYSIWPDWPFSIFSQTGRKKLSLASRAKGSRLSVGGKGGNVYAVQLIPETNRAVEIRTIIGMTMFNGHPE
jgi:hypothetical protein